MEHWIYGLELWGLSLDVRYETERNDETGQVDINLCEVQHEGEDIGGIFHALDVEKRADEKIIDAVNRHLQDESRWDEVFAGAEEA